MVKEKEIIIPVTGSESEINNSEMSSSEQEGAGQSEKNQNDSLEAELKDQIHRLQAEFSNYKKRTQKERETDYTHAKGLLTFKLLPILDDLERMIDHHQVDRSCDVEGVALIFQNLKKVLIEENLEEIAAVGQPFDPEIHEAVGVHETSKEQDGIVIEEWQKGYRFGGRLLRPSSVKVGQYKTTEKN